jgi:5'-3' exonuclease
MIESDDQFDLAIIDADSIIYQIAHYQPSPALAKKAFDDKLKEIMSNTGSIEGAVFIKGADNFRYSVTDDYKGNRKDTIDPEIKERINMLYEYAGTFCFCSDGAEADDYCGVYGEIALKENKRYVICHIDKDLDTLPGYHYNFRTTKLYYMEPQDSYLFLMTQMLTGDSTDNIKGLKGIGPKTAEKILKDLPITYVWSRVIETWKSKVGYNWKEEFTKCANLIYIREYLEDCIPLTYEQLEEKLSWTITDTGSPSVTDQTDPLDSSTTLKTLSPEEDTLEENKP